MSLKPWPQYIFADLKASQGIRTIQLAHMHSFREFAINFYHVLYPQGPLASA